MPVVHSAFRQLINSNAVVEAMNMSPTDPAFSFFRSEWFVYQFITWTNNIKVSSPSTAPQQLPDQGSTVDVGGGDETQARRQTEDEVESQAEGESPNNDRGSDHDSQKKIQQDAVEEEGVDHDVGTDKPNNGKDDEDDGGSNKSTKKVDDNGDSFNGIGGEDGHGSSRRSSEESEEEVDNDVDINNAHIGGPEEVVDHDVDMDSPNNGKENEDDGRSDKSTDQVDHMGNSFNGKRIEDDDGSSAQDSDEVVHNVNNDTVDSGKKSEAPLLLPPRVVEKRKRQEVQYTENQPRVKQRKTQKGQYDDEWKTGPRWIKLEDDIFVSLSPLYPLRTPSHKPLDRLKLQV